jgi:hypothetical protein
MSKTTSFNHSTLLSIPNTQVLWNFLGGSDGAKCYSPSNDFLDVSVAQSFEWFPTSCKSDAGLGKHAMDTGEDDNARRLFKSSKSPETKESFLSSLQTPVMIVAKSASSVYRSSGLTNRRPSRHRISTQKELRLENRIIRLWDNHELFSNLRSGKSGKLIVTPLFGRAFTKLFRESRQLAEYV